MKASKLLLLSAVCLLVGCDKNTETGEGLTKQEHIKKHIGDHPCLIVPFDMESDKISDNGLANYWYNGDAEFVYYYSVQVMSGNYYSLEVWMIITTIKVESETQKIKDSEVASIKCKEIYTIG